MENIKILSHPDIIKLNDNNRNGLTIIREPQSLESCLSVRQPFWKSVLDFAGAIASVIVFSPVFMLSSMLIKIISPGPVFFKQTRIGYLGKPFVIYKFRTMYNKVSKTAHEESLKDEIKNDLVLKKVENDSRIIPFIGNFLRKSCIDELPQLINVLKGEMSLIGPRPELPYAFDEFKQWQCSRLNVLPGMTGLWQVKGKNTTTFTQMIRYDIEYINRLSFWLDTKIFFVTVPAIIKQAWEDSNK